MSRDTVLEKTDGNVLASAASPLPTGIPRKTMDSLPFALVVADARLPDMPLVYVNNAFEKISGYSKSTALGTNCRFMQGDNTDQADRKTIRDALANGQETTVDIVNYRANGEEFVNRLLLTPLHDDEGVSHYLGIQSEHPQDRTYADRAARLDEQLREVQHRVKNHLALLLSLIRMEARKTTDAQTSLGVLANRVEALNVLYDELARPGNLSGDTIALGGYVSRVCSALNMLDGHLEVRMNLTTDQVDCSLDAASQVGLLLSELLTNALQHGFPDGAHGLVQVQLLLDSESDEVQLVVQDDGNGIPEDVDWPNEGSLGARIVRELTKRLQGSLTVEFGIAGHNCHRYHSAGGAGQLKAGHGRRCTV